MNQKQIILVRTDEEAEDINISLGEVVIGRGQLLKCTDKRVSRTHGIIKVSDDGDVVLISKHMNPVFYSEKMKPWVEVHTGSSVVLKDGDEFALLPDSYKFRVTILQGTMTEENHNGDIDNISAMDHVVVKEEMQEQESEKATNREAYSNHNKHIDKFMAEEADEFELAKVVDEAENGLDENTSLPKQKSEPVTEKIHPLESVQVKDETMQQPESVKIKQHMDYVDDNSPCSEIVNRPRVLPAWMYYLSEDDDSGTSKGTSNQRKRKANAKNEKAVPRKTKKVAGKGKDESAADTEASGNQSQKRKRTRKMVTKIDPETSDGEELNKSDKNSDDEDVQGAEHKTKLHAISDEEEEEVEEKAAAETNEEEEDNLDDTKQSNDQTTNTNLQPTATSKKRQKCLYGANCYRKNPQHRVDFSHPGDTDYDDDDLPECPFGTACYRKNKQHRLDYKHTAPPQQAANAPQKPKRKKPTRKDDGDYDDDDDEEDDYDFDDPFLNDASSDDYQPTDSGSEYSAPSSNGEDEDDTKRMLKEAKRFTRKKK